jgi:hypothetical protein
VAGTWGFRRPTRRLQGRFSALEVSSRFVLLHDCSRHRSAIRVAGSGASGVGFRCGSSRRRLGVWLLADRSSGEFQHRPVRNYAEALPDATSSYGVRRRPW